MIKEIIHRDKIKDSFYEGKAWRIFSNSKHVERIGCKAKIKFDNGCVRMVDLRKDKVQERLKSVNRNSKKYFLISPSKVDSKILQKEFNTLATKWKGEIGGQSSVSQTITPTYLKLLKLGKDITPFILQELENFPNFWFIALRTIEEVNPVPPAHMGNVLKMRDAWLTWGKQRNLI